MENKMMRINCFALAFDPMLAGHVGLDQKKVERLMADFRGELVTPPVVVSLKGKYYLLDGAHVVEAMKRLFPDRDVLCAVYFCSGSDDVRELIRAREQMMKKIGRLVGKMKKEMEKI